MSRIKELAERCRTYRRFYEEEEIPEGVLRELAGLSRLIPSTANSQALTFRIIHSKEEREKIFPFISWAGALPDWDGPKEGERPTGYILICCDLSRGSNKMVDDGIAAQTIMLAAADMGRYL